MGGAFRHVEVDPGREIFYRSNPEVDGRSLTTLGLPLGNNGLLGVRTGPVNSYQQWGGEGAVVWGSFSLQGELMTTQIENAADSYLWGGYIYASYFLTGEHREYNKQYAAFGRIHPLENFWWVDSDCEDCNYGHGAWELAARFSYLDYDQAGLTAIPFDSRGELTNFTLGVNWYWSPHIRMMFNYVYSELDDADTRTSATVNGFLTRLQFDF